MQAAEPIAFNNELTSSLEKLIINNPDLDALESMLTDFLKEMVRESKSAGIVLDESNKFFIRCAPESWDQLPFQKTCDRWTKSKRIVLFEFFNFSDRLEFKLTLGPGEKANKQVVFDAIKALKKSDSLSSRSNNSKFINSTLKADGFSPIIQHEVLAHLDYLEEDWDGIQQKIKRFWDEMLSGEMRRIQQAVLGVE